MILILLRLIQNVSVIIMGETVYDKIILIRKLYELMHDREDNIKVIIFYSRITNKDITNFLFKKSEINNMNIIEDTNELFKLKNITQEEYKSKGIIHNKRKL